VPVLVFLCYQIIELNSNSPKTHIYNETDLRSKVSLEFRNNIKFDKILSSEYNILFIILYLITMPNTLPKIDKEKTSWEDSNSVAWEMIEGLATVDDTMENFKELVGDLASTGNKNFTKTYAKWSNFDHSDNKGEEYEYYTKSVDVKSPDMASPVLVTYSRPSWSNEGFQLQVIYFDINKNILIKKTLPDNELCKINLNGDDPRLNNISTEQLTSDLLKKYALDKINNGRWTKKEYFERTDGNGYLAKSSEQVRNTINKQNEELERYRETLKKKYKNNQKQDKEDAEMIIANLPKSYLVS